MASSVQTSALLPTYARANLAFERGEGPWAITASGDRYLDFGAGIAVNALGHAHPHLIRALTEQAQKIWHTSFFTNSGAEANECAIKMARKYHAANGHPEKYRIITFEGAFHGRTLATIAAGGQAKYIEGFGPKVDGFDQVPFGDHEALRAAIGPETAALMIEPVQGEGGIRPVPAQCLRGLRELCDAQGLVLIFDEIQTGVGRTGHLFAYEASGAVPDIMAVAKGIGGGFPMGACLATAEAASGMTAGTHGTTFGGNPMAMAVGNAVLDVILAPGFIENVRNTSLLLRQRLAELKDRHPSVIAEVRGEGLMLGLKLHTPNTDFVTEARAAGLLVIGAGDNVVRLLPPLTIGAAEVGQAFERLDRAATAVEVSLARPAAE
jgi:acetylornithine/N-succinyldiaminopimelate aminotransferase